MFLTGDFIFLNVEKLKRKKKDVNDKDEYFFIINLLDDSNTPCKMFSFDDSINGYIENSIKNDKLKGLQKINIDFDLVFSNNIWNVRLKAVNL